MAHRGIPKRSLEVNPDWNPDVFKAALQRGDRSLKRILKDHATATTGWQGLYSDTCRWRKMDPDLQRLIDQNAKVLNPDKKQLGGEDNFPIVFIRQIKAAIPTPPAIIMIFLFEPS